MSHNNYYGYPNYYYGNSTSYNYRSSPGVSALSGLTITRKKRVQEEKQKCLLAAVIILLLLLIAAIIAVVWLYLNKGKMPTLTTIAPPDNSTTLDVSFMEVNVTATRQDIAYGLDYADKNQNGYQSLSQITCYQISQTAVPDYIVTNCTTTEMKASTTEGVDIFIHLTVLLQNQTPEQAITGLATTLAGVPQPLTIDASNVKLT